MAPDDAPPVLERLAVEDAARAHQRGQLRVDADDVGGRRAPARTARGRRRSRARRRARPAPWRARPAARAIAAMPKRHARPVGQRLRAVAPVRVEVDRQVLGERLRLAVDELLAPAIEVRRRIGDHDRQPVEERVAPPAAPRCRRRARRRRGDACAARARARCALGRPDRRAATGRSRYLWRNRPKAEV